MPALKTLYRKRTLFLFISISLFVICLTVFVNFVNNYIKNDYLGDYHSESHLGVYNRYAVSTDSSQCAHIGKQILDSNGTAADAAIAVMLCMGVTIPHSMGLGGGCLILVYNSTTKQTVVIDGREEAPKESHRDLFANISCDPRLPLSIGVPGELAGYWDDVVSKPAELTSVEKLPRGNYTLHSFPLPGSGDLLAFMLKVMEQYEDDMNHKTGKSLNKTTLFYHRLIETFKLAFSRRTLLEEDTDYNNPFVKQLTSDEFAKETKDLIDDSKTFPIKSERYGNNIYITEDKGTAHVSVIDGEGNAVAVSSSIGQIFGSKIYSKRTGIILNDQLFDFKVDYQKYKYPANETNLINPSDSLGASSLPSMTTVCFVVEL
ncbi:unnamed protein product [Oppiella nova]|uniref:Uncharacterized protein n=1 Tax=Oppiella nova TaxID=334625 RepID=A0A7R9M564_9ACAR|nr:unnamed protein product [Oppiella nova]CAG2170458.1 unnamed protein product [Oppiella nova]